MAYTKGPWFMGDDEVIRCSDGLPPFSSRRSRRENWANGTLMATSPRLLEACKEALRCIARLTPFPITDDPVLDSAISELGDYADSVRDKLRAAIHEATAQGPHDQDGV